MLSCSGRQKRDTADKHGTTLSNIVVFKDSLPNATYKKVFNITNLLNEIPDPFAVCLLIVCAWTGSTLMGIFLVASKNVKSQKQSFFCGNGQRSPLWRRYQALPITRDEQPVQAHIWWSLMALLSLHPPCWKRSIARSSNSLFIALIWFFRYRGMFKWME